MKVALALSFLLAGQAVHAQTEEAVQVTVPGATLHGTLLVPSTGSGVVALIIAGSGPTDRNGNSPMLGGPNNSLKMLAESLAANGVASLRYDKRMIGQSQVPGAKEADLKFTTYSDDAAAWIAQLRKDARFRKVVVIGHSEGALLGTIAAHQTNADALVLLAGAGRPIADVLLEQLKSGAPALADQAVPILRELQAGRSVADVPPMLQTVFRPSIQPYMQSWLPLDPKTELARVRAPRLVVRGTTDVQISAADAARLGEADAAVKVVTIEGMNHVLKIASGTAAEQLSTSYRDPSLPLAPELVRTVVDFIRDAVRN